MSRTRVVETRFAGTKLRAITVIKHSEHPELRTVMLAWGTIEAYGGVQQFIDRHGIKSTAACLTSERWYESITVEEARRKVANWRKSAQRAGLVNTLSFNWDAPDHTATISA